MIDTLGRGTLALALSLTPAATSAQATHILMPTPTTVAWRYYDAAATPVLRINSADGNVGVHVMIPKSIFARGAGAHMIPVRH